MNIVYMMFQIRSGFKYFITFIKHYFVIYIDYYFMIYIGVNEILVKEGFAKFDEEEKSLQEVLALEEPKTKEEARLLDRVHEDTLKMDEKDEKKVTKLEIEMLSQRSEKLRIKYDGK